MSDTKIDMGHSVFTMEHINAVAAMKDINQAKQYAKSILDASTANTKNKSKILEMILKSNNIAKLAHCMTSCLLAHPSEGLKVI